MKLREFREQDIHCKENNISNGIGCDECPASDKTHCADALRNLCGKWLESEGEKRNKISKELEKYYGIFPYDQLDLLKGFISLENKKEEK